MFEIIKELKTDIKNNSILCTFLFTLTFIDEA